MSSARGSKAKTGEVIAPSPGVPARSAMAATATMPSLMTSASHYKLERLLDYALAHADAHKKLLDQSARSRHKLFGRLPRWLAISLLVVILGVIIGFAVWRLVPAASFKLAATRAHVNASMPTPISGYKIGPITSHENTVITTIQSTSDKSKKYTVTERASSQPFASLAASTAAGASGNSTQVQTVQNQGSTYIFSQDGNESIAVCTKGSDTVMVESKNGVLPVDQQHDAVKNAC